MPDLKIHFEFLCAFVPPDLFSKLPKSCWVVLPDFTGHPKTHFPVLLYDRDDRADKELTKAGLTSKEAGERSPKALDTWDKLQFTGEELEIQPDGKPLPAGDSLVTASSLDAILRISRAGVGMEVFNEDFLTSNSNKVACRLFLRQGTLAIGKETKDAFGVYDVTKNPPLVHSQKMAQQVVFTIGFGEFVDLVFRKLGEDAERRLRLKPNTDSTLVNLTIRNCEDRMIWKRDLPPYDQQFNDEINLFFGFSRNYDEAAPPREILLKLSQDGGNGICAPKTFDRWA